MEPATCIQRPGPYYRCYAVLALSTGLLLFGCGGGNTARERVPSSVVMGALPRAGAGDPGRANAVLMRAISLVGTPYRYGGNTPEGGFDCSGLVTYVYRDMLDLRLPRTSRELAQAQGPRIAMAQLAGGDLVFFGEGDEVSHVGIYVGEGRFVHAPNAGGTVRLDHLDASWWRDHYSGARRLLN
ncbi:MAG: C40 family peptidase [Pseudomonadota bacterium]|nr:C40 family peptidase [Pseudomonadota bacterium]